MKVISFASLILFIFLNNFCAIAQKAYTTGLNPTLEKNLEEIRDSDRKIRLRMDTLVKRYGFKSPQVEPVYAEMLRMDSINTRKVEQIMKEYGYPGKKLVGDYLSTTVWLVTQHAPLAFQEKHLTLIQKAADQGDLPKGNLALLVDRIRYRKGQKQLYGSQVHVGSDGKPDGFEPIENEKDVNKRRAEMGLPPLEEYAKQWGINYVLPKN